MNELSSGGGDDRVMGVDERGWLSGDVEHRFRLAIVGGVARRPRLNGTQILCFYKNESYVMNVQTGHYFGNQR